MMVIGIHFLVHVTGSSFNLFLNHVVLKATKTYPLIHPFIRNLILFILNDKIQIVFPSGNFLTLP